MRKTGLYGLGLLLTAAALSISCSGDDGGSDNGGTSGSSTSGANTGGTPSAGSSSGGNNTSGANSTAGNNSTSGSNNGGSNNGGSNNNPQGGEGNDPDPMGGGGPGGPGDLPACGGDVMDGEACDNDDPCEPAEGGVCVCQGQGGGDEWNCINFGGEGGGPGGGFGNADCGDNPMAGEECDGFGQCEGSDTCACFQGDIICQ